MEKTETPKGGKRIEKVITVISFAVLLAVIGCFAYWLLHDKPNLDVLSSVSASLCTVLFALCASLCVRPVFDLFKGAEYTDLVKQKNKSRAKSFVNDHPWITIFIAVVVTRFLVYLIGYYACLTANGYTGGLFETLRSTWQHSTDSNSYIGIADYWYTNDVTLDRHQHIVFFPMYPVLIKLVSFIVRDTFASAIIVSNLCAAFSGIFMFELAKLDMSEKDAFRTVKYLFLLPGACFFGTHMSESLFLMLCLLSMLMLRKKKYLFACIVGAFASFTRSPGVLLLVPIFIEYIADQCKLHREGDKKAFWKHFWLRGLSMLIVPLGLLGYLAVNYFVWGDPMYFMEIQKNNWSQGFGWIFNTASYLVSYMKNYIASGDMRLVFGLSLPQIICIFASLGIMLAAVKKMRPSYTVYFLVYFFIVIGVQWLLSAPRYLSVAFPLPFALTLLTKNKIVDIIVTIICAAFMIWYAIMLALGYPIY